jgi:hypothetical protein
MPMALRRELLLIIVLLIAIALLARAVGFFKPNVESADAAKFVLEDLAVKYPNADASILDTKQMFNSQGDKYFEVKARVTEGFYTPCPEREHIYYNYPVQNFVPQPPDVITRGCSVCTEGTCILNFPEEAIIASHTFSGTEAVSSFIKTWSAVPAVQDLGTEWLVKWDSASSPDYYSVSLDKGGEVLNVVRTQKEAPAN